MAETRLANSDHQQPPQLAVYEWLAVSIILGCLCMLTAISMLYNVSSGEEFTGEPHYLKPQSIEVLVQGAVNFPGSYTLASNTKLKDLFKLVDPMKEANLTHLKPESKLRNGQVVKVPIKPQISVTVIGAVENPGQILVPRGTKLNEIGQYIHFKVDADRDKINRKRRVKSGELIEVPLKEL